MNTIIAAEETSRGWGGPLAMLTAVAIFVAIATLLDTWKRRRDHSPTPAGGAGGVRVKPQVNHGSDTDDTDPDTDDEPDPDTGLQRAHRGAAGAWVRGFSRTLWARDDRPAGELDGDGDQGDEDDGGPETVEETITRLTEQGTPYASIVRQVTRQHQVSESTAKRRIREVRETLAG